MKNLNFLAVILIVMGMIVVSCEGPEGPRGPVGVSGTNGTNGNANVRVYRFPADTFTAATGYAYYPLPITGGMLDSSVVIPYFHDGGGWYPVGGIGPGGLYETRYWLYGYTASSEIGIRVHNLDGLAYSGADITWDSLHIFVIPANQVYVNEPQVDFSNYYDVATHFDSNSLLAR